jgi:hypothetical protein
MGCWRDGLSVLAGASDGDLEALCEQCMQLLAPHLEGYIWQHEPLRLQSSSRQLPPWLLKKQGGPRVTARST